MSTDDSQDLGEVLRRRYGIDGTAGDAQDIEHPYIAVEPHEHCALCGLAPVTSKHIALPADMLRGEAPVSPDDLREQIAEAAAVWAIGNPIAAWRLAEDDHAVKLGRNWGRLISDAVMPAVNAALAKHEKQVRAKVADEALDLAAMMSTVSRASAHALRKFAETLDEDLDDRIARGERQ